MNSSISGPRLKLEKVRKLDAVNNKRCFDNVSCLGYPSRNEFHFDGLTFSSKFCSGNMAKCEKVQEDDGSCAWRYGIWTSPDCAGTEFETTYRTWFYFSVSGVHAGQVLRFRMMNLNNQNGLFENGYRPVTRSLPSNPIWRRIKTTPIWTKVKRRKGQPKDPNKCFEVRWQTTVVTTGDTIFFAFCYPYSYEDTLNQLHTLDNQFSLASTSPKGVAGDSKSQSSENIYYCRELLTRSLEGRRVDVVTISSMDGIQTKRHPRIPGCFQERKQKNQRNHKENVNIVPYSDRAFKFIGKKIVYISSRVHPGHYRADTLGANLNRCYKDTDMKTCPTIYASLQLLKYYNEDKCCPLFAFIDLHAHATKRGCFMFGNHLPTVKLQIENILLPRLASLNTLFLEPGACSFSEKNMNAVDKRGESKDGCGRVGIYKLTGCTHCYTLEANYNNGIRLNTIPSASNDGGRASPGRSQRILGNSPGSRFYSIKDWLEVGKAVAISLLDIIECNPWSRVPNSRWGSLQGLRSDIRIQIQTESPYKEEIIAERKLRRTEKKLEKKVHRQAEKKLEKSSDVRGRIINRSRHRQMMAESYKKHMQKQIMSSKQKRAKNLISSKGNYSIPLPSPPSLTNKGQPSRKPSSGWPPKYTMKHQSPKKKLLPTSSKLIGIRNTLASFSFPKSNKKKRKTILESLKKNSKAGLNSDISSTQHHKNVDSLQAQKSKFIKNIPINRVSVGSTEEFLTRKQDDKIRQIKNSRRRSRLISIPRPSRRKASRRNNK